MNFAVFVEMHARSTPEAAALVDRSLRWTYRQLNDAGNHFANLLTRSGIVCGDRVMFQVANRSELVVALLGSWKHGAIGIPVNTRLAPVDVARLAAHAGAKLLVVPESCADAFPGIPVLSYSASQRSGKFWEELEREAATFRSIGRQNSAIANLLYTSGTTSLPKAVIHTHGMRATIAGTMADLFRLSTRDRGFAISPIFHTGGMSVLCNALFCGGTLVLMEKWDVPAFASLLRSEAITFMHLVTTLVVDVVRADRALFDRDASSVRFAWGGGHATDREYFEEFERRVGGVFLQGYSRTEGGIAYNPLDPSLRRFDAHGRTSENNCNLSVRDPATGLAARAGEHGEIVVRGDGVTPGYWNVDGVRPPPTYEHGWTGTGDIGFFDEAGDLHFVGREDHMIKTGGENVYPNEVSAVLTRIAGIDDAVVFGVPDERLGQRIAAVIAASTGSLTPDAIERACRQHLPGFKIPRTIRMVGKLPRLGSEKVDLNACRELVAE